ncbi:MAG TPA: hypothetical protein VG798_03575 [Rhizomicrobium sp.]|nr:hypothetical protein [Rhizomicrobium sp.]
MLDLLMQMMLLDGGQVALFIEKGIGLFPAGARQGQCHRRRVRIRAPSLPRPGRRAIFLFFCHTSPRRKVPRVPSRQNGWPLATFTGFRAFLGWLELLGEKSRPSESA